MAMLTDDRRNIHYRKSEKRMQTKEEALDKIKSLVERFDE